MGAVDLLDRLVSAGLTFTARGESLAISPWAAVPIELLVELRDYKLELLALLAGGEVAANEMLAPQPSLRAASRCTDCRHLLKRGTCGEPVRAGLIPADAGFGLAWPPAGYANTCASYSRKPTAPAQERPYSLTKARGGTAHAEPWDDAAMARFQARAAAIQRRGFGQQDAEDLAEQLHLRDVQAAHRIYCLECRHLDGSVSTGLRCGNHRFASVGRDLPVALVTMAQVCSGFSAMPARVPMADDATQPSTR